jgi:hypothetical protein
LVETPLRVMKLMLLVGLALGLSARELAPVGDSLDQDPYVAPVSSAHGLSTDPRAYRDDSNPNADKMMASFDRTP